jgi:hypothetical protein
MRAIVTKFHWRCLHVPLLMDCQAKAKFLKNLRFEYFENQLPMIFICLGARDLSIGV